MKLVVGFGAFVLRLLRLQRLIEDHQGEDDGNGSGSGAS